MIDMSPDQAKELATKLSWNVERHMFNNARDDCPRRQKCEDRLLREILLWSVLSPIVPKENP